MQARFLTGHSMGGYDFDSEIIANINLKNFFLSGTISRVYPNGTRIFNRLLSWGE